ncbi:MAG TPA: hypothetical protein VJZ51_06690 [Bacilli bacterium]|nr:hypothetical protein [Bacilli bacterium]
MKKYIIISFFAISLVVVSLVFILLKPTPTIKLTTIKKAYSYVSCFHDEEKMQVSILINNRDSAITNEKKCSSAAIADKNNHNEILLGLEDITYNNKQYKINDETFYQYTFAFQIPLKTDEKFLLEIENAYLCLNYDNVDVKIEIGSFSFYKVPYLGDEKAYLTISKLKPIVNEFQNEKTLVALVIGTSNQTKEAITITRVVPLDLNMQFSAQDILTLEKELFPNSNISTLLGKNYTISSSNLVNDEVTLMIPANTTVNYLFPIKYNGELKTNKVGFLIEYTVGSEARTLYYDEFLFFTTTENSPVDLDVLTYENR